MRIITVISALLMFASTSAAESSGFPAQTKQIADTSHFAALDARLDEYLEAIKGETIDAQQQEADFLIEVCSDSLIRQRTALKLYEHYISSPVMGAESVAVHIYDKWFSTGKVKMHGNSDLFTAKFFAETNRRSLLGCRAPEMTLTDNEGAQVKIMSPSQTGWRVLFFYDTDCAKCKMESMMLKSVLENNAYPLTFYAVYIGTDKEAWTQYISERLDYKADALTMVHLWDPELKADIGFNYGVFQTPKMFLVNPAGTIVGRGLNASALEQLTKLYLAPKEYEYGNDNSTVLYDRVFAPLEGSMTCGTISEIGGYIEKSTLAVKDTLLFKQMTGDLLYYITNQKDESFKCGTEAFVDKFILSRPDVWNTPDDSLKVVGLASMLKNMASLSPVGTRLPSIKVHGVLKTSRARTYARQDIPEANSAQQYKTQKGTFNISRLRSKGRTIIIFHTEGCKICEKELNAATALLMREKGLKVLEINMDELFSSYPSEADTMMRSFDLSSLPFILTTDRKGRVISKYITLTEQ